MKKSQKSKESSKNIVNRESRYFSETARRAIVEEIEQGLSKAEASRRYGVSKGIIFKWIAKYSLYYQKRLRQVVEHESDSAKLGQLREELEQAYALLGREKAKTLYLETLIDEASEGLSVDIKKNFAPRHLLNYTDKKDKKQ